MACQRMLFAFFNDTALSITFYYYYTRLHVPVFRIHPALFLFLSRGSKFTLKRNCLKMRTTLHVFKNRSCLPTPLLPFIFQYPLLHLLTRPNQTLPLPSHHLGLPPRSPHWHRLMPAILTRVHGPNHHRLLQPRAASTHPHPPASCQIPQFRFLIPAFILCDIRARGHLALLADFPAVEIKYDGEGDHGGSDAAD